MSYRRNNDDMVEPIISGYQLVGDSQFLRFSEQLLRKERRKSNGIAYLGLCVSGQKISDLLRRVKEGFYPTSERAIVMIGTNDLLQNTAIDKMRTDIEALVLELIERGVRKLILLTIPPVPRLAASFDHWHRLKEFNNHIKGLHNGEDVFVVDAYSKFVKNSHRPYDSRSSSVSSYNSSPKRKSITTSSLKFPSMSSSPMELPNNLRISVLPENGRKRKVYLLDDGDQDSLNDSAGSVFSDGTFSPPVPKRRSLCTSYGSEDDHNDRFCDENSISEDSDVAEDINLDLFEEYFSRNTGRKDLIHLNVNGLRIIKNLIIKEIES